MMNKSRICEWLSARLLLNPSRIISYVESVSVQAMNPPRLNPHCKPGEQGFSAFLDEISHNQYIWSHRTTSRKLF
jgi:hypothetical protein